MPFLRRLAVVTATVLLSACSFSKNPNKQDSNPTPPAQPVVVQVPEVTQKIDNIFDCIDKGDSKTFEILLSSMDGQQVNAFNSQGETALFYSAKLGKYYFAKRLVEKGAMPLKLNSDGVSEPLSIARTINQNIVDLLEAKIAEQEEQLKRMLSESRWSDASDFADSTYQSKHTFYQEALAKSIDASKVSYEAIQSDSRWKFLTEEIESGQLTKTSFRNLIISSSIWNNTIIAAWVIEKNVNHLVLQQEFFYELLETNNSEKWFVFSLAITKKYKLDGANAEIEKSAFRLIKGLEFRPEKILEYIEFGLSVRNSPEYKLADRIVHNILVNKVFLNSPDATLVVLDKIKADNAEIFFPSNFIFQAIELYSKKSYLDSGLLDRFIQNMNYFIKNSVVPISELDIYLELSEINNIDSRDKMIAAWIGSLSVIDDKLLDYSVKGQDAKRASLIRLLPRSVSPKLKPIYLEKLSSILKSFINTNVTASVADQVEAFYLESQQWGFNLDSEYLTDIFILYLKNQQADYSNDFSESPAEVVFRKYAQKFQNNIHARESELNNIISYLKIEIEIMKRLGDRRESRAPLILSLSPDINGSKLLKWNLKGILGNQFPIQTNTKSLNRVEMKFGVSLIFDLLEIAAMPTFVNGYLPPLYGPSYSKSNPFSFLNINPEPVVKTDRINVKKRGPVSVEIMLEDFFDIYLDFPSLEEKYCKVSRSFESLSRDHCLIKAKDAFNTDSVRNAVGRGSLPVKSETQEDSFRDADAPFLYDNGYDEEHLRFRLVRSAVPDSFLRLESRLKFQYLNNALNLTGNPKLMKKYVGTIRKSIDVLTKRIQESGDSENRLSSRLRQYETLLEFFPGEVR